MNKPWIVTVALALSLLAQVTFGQERQGQRPPDFQSVSVSAEKKISFRVFAPKATAVRLTSSDLPASPPQGIEMTKEDNGVWSCTTNSVPAGAYRYSFNVDGITVIDPRNPVTSESNANTWSLCIVTGSDKFDLKNVPHGSVSVVHYFSTALNKSRRLHVYTPPGYERSTEDYPVLYLLHGAFDCDDSWSSVGQAGQILDNLIESGKAKPMIVVMPMGHTGPFSFGPGNSFEKQMSEFAQDFLTDIMPLAEKRYRISPERKHHAIAGLSMGGAHTLDIAFTKLDAFAYVAVFSSGIFGIDRGGPSEGPGAAWMAAHKAGLENKEARAGLQKVWFATGKDDFLLATSRATVDALKAQGFQVEYHETEGGHTWLNWRDYLHDFAKELFQ